MLFLFLQLYYGAPYPPMIYQPQMIPGFHPYYGAVMYRPPGMYPSGLMGKLPQNKIPSQKLGGGHKQKVNSQQQNLPVQRDDDDERSADSPKQEAAAPKPATPPKQQQGAQAPSGKKSTPKRMVALNMMPRMPMYPPYYAYSPYMIPPEDPRYMGMQLPPQPPYYYTYGNIPRAQYPYMVPHQVPMQVQPRPGSGSVSPASSSDGTARGTSQASPTGSSQSDAQSPGSAAYHQPQPIQLLPNVKHVPSHLLYSTPGSGNNSRSSTPVLANSPVPTQQGARDSPRNSQGDLEFPTYRRRQHSGPRPVSQSPSYSSQSSHESSTSPVLNGDQLASAAKPEPVVTQKLPEPVREKPSHIAAKLPRKILKLNTHATGFSRQFSDELGTPTEITNIVKMIDENIDEREEDEEVQRATELVYTRESLKQSKPSPPAGKLFLNLPMRPGVTEAQQSSSSSSQEEEVRPVYTGLPRHPIPFNRDTEFDPSTLEPQTPMTPAGFCTPGTDMNTDPLEILRNLNINNDNLNRSAHGHF